MVSTQGSFVSARAISPKLGKNPLFWINKKAFFDYEIEQTWEAGIVLLGHEVKSLKNNRFSCGETIVRFSQGSLCIINMHIDAYTHTAPALLHGYQPNRSRFILLHKKEIGKIAARLSQGGYTLVLTKLYNKKSLIKCEIGLARKKKNIVKKQIMKERDIDRQTKRDIKMVG